MTPNSIVSSVFVFLVPKLLHTFSNPPGLEKGSARKEETKWANLPFAFFLPCRSEERECVHCWVNTLINSNLWAVEEVGNKEKRGSLGGRERTAWQPTEENLSERLIGPSCIWKCELRRSRLLFQFCKYLIISFKYSFYLRTLEM